MAQLFLSLSLLLLLNGCLANKQYQKIFQQKNECQIQRINALEPTQIVQSEAGFTEFFDTNEQQFQCAGVEVVRHQIQPQGLLLPSYTSTPILFYVEQGNGVQGVMLPGCPETYESSQQQFEGRKGGSSFQDRHQKLHHFRQGDMVAIPTGAAHWIYNNGQEDLVIIALLDSTNAENQLDQVHRRFFLAGNSQNEQQQQGQPIRTWGRGQQGGSQQKGSNNIFQGFDVEFLAEAFNVDQETAQMLKCENDQRGHIVMVERGLTFVSPIMSREQQGQQQHGGRGPANGLEETICSMKLRENIDDISKADSYNPKAGHCTHLNSYKFPILQLLQLSAERGVLKSHGIVAPHWIMNAHNIIYVTNGNMRIQIVNDQGQSVFNDQVRERQLVVVPQNFAVVKQAGEQGCSWISFRTNDNAMINTLAGRTSAMRALPLAVLTNAYQMSREDAQQLKYSRDETVLLSPSTIPYAAGRV
ncbi:legumin A [Artemisia annua]|uniref:Legumin A n=1 Tax=Artemisia annua TaxID=35608 RepID=A0A2U1MFF2_ARTAN|nr:legumin A [Artemisia annua]